MVDGHILERKAFATPVPGNGVAMAEEWGGHPRTMQAGRGEWTPTCSQAPVCSRWRPGGRRLGGSP